MARCQVCDNNSVQHLCPRRILPSCKYALICMQIKKVQGQERFRCYVCLQIPFRLYASIGLF